MEEVKSCCFTGHRPAGLPWGENEGHILCRRTREALAVAIERAYLDGYRRFYSGMARGIDLMAAEVTLHCQELHPDIELVAAIPYAGMARSLPPADLERYCRILDGCREENIHILSPQFYKSCFIQRDRYMVDRCQRIIAVYDGRTPGGTQYTVGYALQRKLGLVAIDPNNPKV